MNQVGEYPIPTGDIPVIIPLLDESGLAWFAEEIKYRIDTGNDCPVIISGYPGMGKSTLAQKVARYIDPDFSNDHVHFRLDSMMEDMANMPMAIPHKRYPMAIFDESGTGLFAQEWQDPKQKKVVKIFGVNRKKGAISIFVLPGFNDLNSRLREKRIYWWCHICQDSRVAVVRRNHENQFGTDAFWRARFAYTFDRIPPNDPAWIAYEETEDQVHR